MVAGVTNSSKFDKIDMKGGIASTDASVRDSTASKVFDDEEEGEAAVRSHVNESTPGETLRGTPEGRGAGRVLLPPLN